MAMNYIRCENGHFFDKNTFITCPNCGAGPATSSKTPTKKKQGFFSKLKSKSDRGAGTKPVAPVASSETMSMYSPNAQNDLPMEKRSIGERDNQVQEEQTGKNGSYGLWEANTYSQSVGAPSTGQYKEPDDVVSDKRIEKEHELDSSSVSNPSVQDQIKQAAGNEGKTFGYFSLKKADSISGTVSSTSSVEDVPGEPVVGWFVCIKGPSYGQSFNIYCGRNSIGRSTNNRIAITGDNSISREKHAIVMYEPKKREFWMQPSDSSSLAYCNGDVIMSPIKIGKKSEIELGNTRLLLIPLCDEEFSWDEYSE